MRSSFIQRWGFSVVLLTLYLLVFNVWLGAPARWVPAIGQGVSAVLLLACVELRRRGYFANPWDGLFHVAVVLDILLEGTLISEHDHLGFYLCGLGFALVLLPYRRWALKQQPKDRNDQT